MTYLEREALAALFRLSGLTTAQERFINRLLDRPWQVPLPLQESEYLWRLVYRYSRRLPNSILQGLLLPRGMVQLIGWPMGQIDPPLMLRDHTVVMERTAMTQSWSRCRSIHELITRVPPGWPERLFACAVWRVYNERVRTSAWRGERNKRQQAIENAEQYEMGQCPSLGVGCVVQLENASQAARVTATACKVVTDREKADILRDIVADPLRVQEAPVWRARIDGEPWDRDHCPGLRQGEARRLGRVAQTERLVDGSLDPVCLMAIADALEEQGHAPPLLLAHLRDHGLGKRHWLGCWAVRLVANG